MWQPNRTFTSTQAAAAAAANSKQKVPPEISQSILSSPFTTAAKAAASVSVSVSSDSFPLASPPLPLSPLSRRRRAGGRSAAAAWFARSLAQIFLRPISPGAGPLRSLVPRFWRRTEIGRISFHFLTANHAYSDLFLRDGTGLDCIVLVVDLLLRRRHKTIVVSPPKLGHACSCSCSCSCSRAAAPPPPLLLDHPPTPPPSKDQAMRRGGAKDAAAAAPDKVMGPLFPRLHVNDTIKGGPRAPPRNKMALYEQFSVPSHRYTATAAPSPAPPWRPASAVTSTSASQVGGSDRPLFPSFCVPSTEPVRSSDQMNANSNGRAANGTRAESGRQSAHLKSKDTNAAGPAAECSSRHRENANKNSSGKKLANDDDFTVPSILYSGVPPHSSQEKLTLFPTTSPCKSVPAKYSSNGKRHLDVSDVKSKGPSGIKDTEPVQVRIDLEEEETTPSFQILKDKTVRSDPKVSSFMDRLNKYNVADKQYSEAESYRMRANEDAVKTQNPPKNGTVLLSKPYADREPNGGFDILKHGLKDTGEKRKRSHHGVEQNDDLSDSSVESLPGMEISPDDVVGAIGAKHFWKARRAIVNQQRVFAVQVFELHRLIKVQKLIAASPHLLIEGDPCLGKSLGASKKKLAGDVAKQLQSAKNNDEVQPTQQQQLENSKENTEANQPSPSQDDAAGVQHNNQAVTNGAISSNPPLMPTPDNKQNSWCIPAPPSQWLVPVMTPSEGLVYKPYTGHCPPAGSFMAPPFFASCGPVSLPSTAGDFMNSAYGVAMPHQPQHMGVPGPPPMPPMYFPPFSMPVMNPAVSASAVEQVSHVAASQRNGQIEQHTRNSCNASNLRSEAVSAGVCRVHASRDSELQGSSASSPFDRQQGEGRGPAPSFPASSVGNRQAQAQPSSGSRENPSRVIRVVPHTARTASESAARIFQSIQMERKQNDP